MNTQSNIKRWLSVLLAVMMISAVFAGCGGSTGTGSTPAETSTTSSATSAANNDTEEESAEAPTETATGTANILRYGVSGVENKFNPIMHSNVYDRDIDGLIFESLIDNDASGAYVNTSICTYEVSEDKLTYTFTLTDGVTFSNGTPMTAEDVAFTYETIAHPDYDGPRGNSVMVMAGYEAYHSGATDVFEGVKVIDEKTVSFTFLEASPINIMDLAYGILSKEYYQFETWEQFLALIDKPMGSGPFVLEAYEPKQYWELARNENYWDPANAAKIDGVLISEVPKESILGAIQSNTIDFAQADLTKDNYDSYTAMDHVNLQTFVGNGFTFMGFNTTRPLLSDHRVRQALMYSLDRKSFIDAAYGSSELAQVGAAPFSPLSWAVAEGTELELYDFDMAKAEQLMTEAGWVKGSDGILEKDGQKFSISWLVYTEAAWPSVLAEMAADSWKQLGVDLKIELIDFNTVGERTFDAAPEDKDFDIFTMGFSVDADPDQLGGLFDYGAYTAGGFCASGYYNERAQELINLGRTEFDQSKRQEYYTEFAQIMNEQVPTVIIAYRNELWPTNTRVSGLDLGPFHTWAQAIRNVTLS